MLTELHVWDIATKYDVAEGAPNRTLLSAFLIMGRQKFRRLPITKIGKIHGILTVTDLMRAVKEKGLPEAFKEKIQDYMTPNPKTIVLDKTVVEAAKVMKEGGFGSLIVVGKVPHKLQGIMTERDILKHCRDEAWKDVSLMDFGEKLEKDMHKLPSNTPLTEILAYMADNLAFRILTVNENEKVDGIISANDITHLIAMERDEFTMNPNFLKSLTAQFLSTKNVLTLPVETNLYEAVEFMNQHNIGGVPLTKDGEVVGMFTERLLTYYIADNY
ncbi:MAG: CBS domain-containing protein [Methanobacteriota archaeon]|nr:MAG: CBS domain-containing protein [Euryarchaeota archaeon]